MNNKKALKAGFWYTVSNFFIRALSIISTPIFTRIMSVEEYGDYSNFASWITIVTILTTLDLHSTINRARFDFKKDIEQYISTITILGIAVPSALYFIFVFLPDPFCNFFNMNIFCIHMLFLNVLFSSAINIYQAKQRITYNYKNSIIITFLLSISTILLSILLVSFMSNKLYGRIIGITVPTVIINIFLSIILIVRGKRFKFSFVKYSVKICLPYVPHLLAMNILSQYDKIQIKKFCGANELGLYSLAYSCALIINIFLNSLNNAWSPWLGEKINEKKYDEIRRISKKYITLFVLISCGIFLVSPEFLMFFGGEKYKTAIYIMPPVICGSIFQLLYTLYVNVEMFEKKMWGVAIATSIVAVINIILNAVFIPKYGYIAAAYTTLFCYFLLFIFHYLQTKRIKMDHIYSFRFNIFIGFLSLVFGIFVYILYKYNILRYLALLIYTIIFIIIIYKNKEAIISIFKKEG